MTTVDHLKLLFLLIDDEELIYEATGWQPKPLEHGSPFPKSRRQWGRESSFDEKDLRIVDAHWDIIRELSLENVNSINQASAEILWVRNGPLRPSDLPLKVTITELSARVSQPKLSILELALLSLGLPFPENGHSGIGIFIREDWNSKAGRLELSKFPLVRALMDRTNALGNSGLKGVDVSASATTMIDTLQAIEWLDAMSFRLPKGMLKVAHKNEDFKAKPAQETSDKVNPKALSSLYQIIHSLAARRPYEYDEAKPNNGAIGRIENAILDAGLKMSRKTIRKYLREAKEEADRIKDKNQ